MWIAVVVLAVINFTLKAAGPVVLRDRRFGDRTQATLDALPVALLAGLITVEFLGDRWAEADATLLPGLVTAAVARLCRAPDLICILAGVAVTAGLRLVV